MKNQPMKFEDLQLWCKAAIQQANKGIEEDDDYLVADALRKSKVILRLVKATYDTLRAASSSLPEDESIAGVIKRRQRRFKGGPASKAWCIAHHREDLLKTVVNTEAFKEEALESKDPLMLLILATESSEFPQFFCAKDIDE